MFFSPLLLLLLLAFLTIHLLFSVVSTFDSSFTSSPFIKVWLVLSLFFSLSFSSPSFANQKVARTEGRTNRQMLLWVTYDLRNKCFPVQRLSVSNRGCMRHDGVRVEVLLGKERQVNMSPNKAWVHFAATLPPGHRPLHIQVKSAFCLPKPCDLWPGSIDQTS